MDLKNIKNTFNSLLPEELTTELLESYNKGLNEYSKENWKYFINEMAQFNEIVYRIIEFLLTNSYTPINKKLPIFNEKILIIWENISNKEENIKIIIPRILYSMHCIRNKRGAIHKNEISPNKMDATILLYDAKWILAEMFRICSKLSIPESQKIIDSIINKEIDLLWYTNDKIRILNKKLKCSDQILILLYSTNTMSFEKLMENIEYSNKSTFKKILLKLHKDRFIEYDGVNCTISPKGSTYAEQVIRKNKRI